MPQTNYRYAGSRSPVRKTAKTHTAKQMQNENSKNVILAKNAETMQQINFKNISCAVSSPQTVFCIL